jgi:hypothetical protein
VLASVLAAFCAGPALGMAVAHGTAPGSELAQITSPLAFALAFAGGLMLWFGVGVVSVAGQALYRLLRGTWRRQRTAPGVEVLVPPGHGAFLPLALLCGLLAGLVAGVVPESKSFLGACAAHLAVGSGYGLLLRVLAQEGLLPFPEPS